MSQLKRGNKGRGISGTAFNRERGKRGSNTVNTHNQNNDDVKSHNGEVYHNKIMIHALTKLLGCQVTIETCNGCVYDGILKTMSPKGDLVLEMAHKCAKRNDHNKIEDFVQVPSKNELIETLVLGAKQVVYVSVANVDLDEIKKDNFTDQAISSRGINGQLGNDRQLQKWEDPSVEPDESLRLDEHNVNGMHPNEMFAANESIGVKSTFEPNMLAYTTPVEGSKELEDKAEKLAREIEQGNSHRERKELDSGKTEEERFSSVVRETSQTSKGRPQHALPVRDENKRDGTVDSLDRSSPKPQRPQQRERDAKVLDGISKPAIPVEQAKAIKDATSDQVKKMQPQVVGGEQLGISIVNIKQTSPGPPKPTAPVPEATKAKEVDELKKFHTNFKLLDVRDKEQEDQFNKETVNNPPNTEQEQKEQTKVTEPVESTQNDKPKYQLNPDAPTFHMPEKKTPLVQQTFVHAHSPNQNIHRGYNPPMIRAQSPMRPRSPFPQGARYMRPDDTHGGSPISATEAAGRPIIAQPGPFQQFVAVQPPHHQFSPNMIHQIQHQSYMPHPGHQGQQQHYIPPQTVGIPTSQSTAQGYQENTGMPFYVSNNVQMAQASYPGSPQPSPTTGGPYVQYFQIPQQQGNQHMSQAVIAHSQPSPQMFVVPQHTGQQQVNVHGIPGPGNPILNFVPGQHYQQGN